jgi:hypothetical protein
VRKKSLSSRKEIKKRGRGKEKEKEGEKRGGEDEEE